MKAGLEEKLWILVRDALDETKSKENLRIIESPEELAELFGMALVELARFDRQLLLVQRATDVLCAVIDPNVDDSEVAELVEKTDVLDESVGALGTDEEKSPT